MKFLALVVLYKSRIELSETILSLAKQPFLDTLDLFVWDNSPQEADFEGRQWLASVFRCAIYYHDGRNTALATLYNTVIQKYLRSARCNYDYLILLDQDSTLESDFLMKMNDAVTNNPAISLLLPIVTARVGGQIVSPASLYYFKGVSWKWRRFGIIKSRFTTAINSGMTIASNYLISEFSGYPPEVPFYGTDNWFCQDYSTKKQWLYIIDSTIKHDLAQFGVESNEVKLWRHKQNVEALQFLNRKGVVRSCCCHLYLRITCIRRAIRYRDVRFLSMT